jgi:hypothetical protein
MPALYALNGFAESLESTGDAAEPSGCAELRRSSTTGSAAVTVVHVRCVSAMTDVELVGGPWPGKTVVILSIPAIGTALSSADWGLKGGNANDGRYVVTAVDGSANRVVASWEGTA